MNKPIILCIDDEREILSCLEQELFPLSQMLYWTIKFPENLFDIDIISLTLNTIYLVILSSFVLILFSLCNILDLYWLIF